VAARTADDLKRRHVFCIQTFLDTQDRLSYTPRIKSDEVIMSTICSMIQGCGPFEQFKVITKKSKEFPPSREMKIGVLTFAAPAAGVSKHSEFGPAGDYNTPENAGITAADAVSAALTNIPHVILTEHSQLENILNEHELSLRGNNPDAILLGQILSVDALLFGDVMTFQRWYDMAGHGGIVVFSARLINGRTAEVLFSMICTAVKRGRMPEDLVRDLTKDAIRKLLERGGPV
jgi:curli biogenesis system outer membrane secretion channel CsgG